MAYRFKLAATQDIRSKSNAPKESKQKIIHLSKSTQLDGISPIDRKLRIITSELDIMKPETLLLTVDPSIDAISIIEQIQTYYGLIHKEMAQLVF
jgi:hypothetical protein